MTITPDQIEAEYEQAREAALDRHEARMAKIEQAKFAQPTAEEILQAVQDSLAMIMLGGEAQNPWQVHGTMGEGGFQQQRSYDHECWCSPSRMMRLLNDWPEPYCSPVIRAYTWLPEEQPKPMSKELVCIPKPVLDPVEVIPQPNYFRRGVLRLATLAVAVASVAQVPHIISLFH